MSIPRLVAIAVLGVVVGAGWSGAATYYVDRNHAMASDSNPGTETLPWLTIQHAADTLVAGDTVYVKAGTYPEQVTVTRSGAAGAEIVFAVYPGHSVTVDGTSVPLAEWDGLFQVTGASYVRISGFHVTNSGPFGTNPGIQVDPGSHITIDGNHTSFTASSGILVWGSTDVLIAGNEVDHPMTTGAASRNECITVGRTTGFEVRGNHVHDNLQERGEGICLKDGSTLGSAHHNHVHDLPRVGIYVDAWTEHTYSIDVWANTVHDIDGDGIALASEQGGLLEQIRVVNNFVWHNRYVGISISDCCISSHPMSDLQVVNNSVWGNGWADWGGGFGTANTQATGLVLRNNALAGNLSFEITFEGVGTGNATLDHNLIDGWHGYPEEACGSDCRIGDPLWVDPATGDLHLQLGSLAIDNGSSLLAPVDDYDGDPRPQGAAWDIGADEYGNTTLIFADGFESGDTSAWSVVVP